MTPSHPIRRALAVAAGAAIAVVGAIALAVPSVAATPTAFTGGGGNDSQLAIDGRAECLRATGEWRITWTLTNKRNRDATITDKTSNPDTTVTVVGGSTALKGSVIPKKSGRDDGELTAVQTVPGSADKVKLTVKVSWPKEHGKSETSTQDETVTFRGGPCTAPPSCVDASKASYEHTFAGPAGTASVKLKGDLPLCQGGSQSFSLVSYYAPAAVALWPQYAYDTATATIDRDHPSVELSVDVPGCFTQVDLVWGGESVIIDPLVAGGARYNDLKLGSGGAPGNRSSGPAGWYNGGNLTCAIPAATLVSACDGSVNVHLTNGADAHYAAPFTVTAEGGFSESASVNPGESKDIVVPAAKAGSITVKMDGKTIKTGSWQRPEDCPLPTVAVEATCDTFAVSVTNPAGNLPVEATIVYNGETKRVTVAPGTSEKATFTAGADTDATVTFTDYDLPPVTAVYTKPASCNGSPSPSPSESSPTPPSPSVSPSSTPPTESTPTPSPSTGGGLPVTGTQIGLFGGVGAVLVGAGILLVLGARRRRLTDAA
ncbi:hypothetical protein F4553_005627 [Allocatelliglobosispora scoriae]|uniref:LPXTG cell wall anchor domain-containing protein n=1 Tax=Allocatelliglobosispora scoriae TaxID=643052 RepID=A0A841BZ52_9ACTN|nr:cell wall anchor protein [Allocatelliglobosispora scoriae]MBB5872193.1 hypothetical protein [Allocatelliglobosispora scoriae]